MKFNNHFTSSWRMGLLAVFLTTALLHGADETSGAPAKPDAKADLDKQLADAIACYQTLQLKPETAIPDEVVAKSKGILILNRWSGAIVVGGTQGSGIGFNRDVNGKFSAPAFYTLGGASIGLQVGASNIRTVAFLMTDKALKSLTENKYIWSGNVLAIAGPNVASKTTLDSKADVILYQQVSGLDVGAMVAATQLAVDAASNRKYYNDDTLTPVDIFSSKVLMPEPAAAFVKTLNKQAGVAESPPRPPGH